MKRTVAMLVLVVFVVASFAVGFLTKTWRDEGNQKEGLRDFMADDALDKAIGDAIRYSQWVRWLDYGATNNLRQSMNSMVDYHVAVAQELIPVSPYEKGKTMATKALSQISEYRNNHPVSVPESECRAELQRMWDAMKEKQNK